ncbi:MAG: phosphate signaling complex protein PhoU [Eubacteriales bacterium]
MRNKFEAQLLELNTDLVMMGALCEKAISMSIQAYMNNNATYAKIAKDIEREIDDKEKEIERLCMRLLLQQQPVAKDLRIVSAALKMITDLERIGDQAADIAELSKYASAEDMPDYLKNMAEATVKMVTGAIDSFVKRDLDCAQEVIDSDDVVDDYFDIAKNDVIARIKDENENTEAIIDMLMVAKYLERIADHATNVAEWVVFSITGVHKDNKI